MHLSTNSEASSEPLSESEVCLLLAPVARTRSKWARRPTASVGSALSIVDCAEATDIPDGRRVGMGYTLH